MGTQSKMRKTFCLTGVSSGPNYRTFENNFPAMEKAVKERVFFVKTDGEFHEPHRPDAEFFASNMRGFAKALRKLLRPTTPMKPSAFAATYQGRRRTAYEHAIKQNEQLGFEDKLSHITAFMKFEKYNFSAKMPVPRVISPRHPRYIVETGRYVKPIEKQIYKAIDAIFGDKTVYKGMNMSDRGKALKTTWDRFTRPVAIGLDASRFDQHVSNSALRWEHSVYSLCYPKDKYFKHLMKLQRNNKCFARGPGYELRYNTIHNRQSGDSNTSLGNVLLMCGMVHSYLSSIGIDGALINDGDDCVVIMEEEGISRFESGLHSYFSALGFKMTVEAPVRELEHIVFCQAQPIFTPDGYIMIRDPRTAISKDAVSLKPLDNPSVYKMWMSAVGKGGMALTGGIPVWQEFYSLLERSSCGAKPLTDPVLETGFFRMSVGMSRRYSPVHPRTRLSFFVAFGMSPEEQVQCEAIYRTMVLEAGSIDCRFALFPGLQ